MADCRTLTRETLDRAVTAADVLVIEFTAPANPTTTLETVAARVPDAVFARIDRADEAAVAALFGLRSGPGLLIFRQRVVLYLESGAHSAERIEGLVRQVRGLDMEAVRAAIEEEKRAEIALRMRRVCPTARRGPG